MNLPAELFQVQRKVREIAADFGLDFFETIFELLDFEQINEVAAFGGFPTRYPHWRFGMEYEQLQKGYVYGLHKIYELVINNDPCYAYLLSSNSLVDNKLVIAHVYGHCDFFKNNVWFSKTNRKMMDQMANHATRIRRIVDRVGQEKVEDFLDRALSIENLVDLPGEFVERRQSRARPGFEEAVEDEEADADAAVYRLRSKDYMDEFINPPGFLEARKKKKQKEQDAKKKIPGGSPLRDLPGFLLQHAPLERWEWELLNIVREEALYFAPQRATKIMNEGWASYWHRKIMVERILTDEEVVDYADVVSGTLAEGPQLNPYKIGLELWLDIEDRWNRGRHGLEYDRCDDLVKRENWDSGAMQGKEQIFLCRRIHNDITFIDEYLTEEFCHRHKLFVYRWNPRSRRREIVTRDFRAVKEQLLRQLANGGAPVIEVTDINFKNRGELYLMHRWDGQDLRADWAQATLRNIQSLWKRPAHIESRSETKVVRYTSDGSEDTVQVLGDVE